MPGAKRRRLPNLAAIALGAGLCAVCAAGEPEPRLDLASFPGDLVDNVVVPVPGEVLAILEKLGGTDWAAEVRQPVRVSLRLRTDYALALGVAVADGFVAVQAQDRAKVEAVRKAVLERAQALGLRQAVTRHCEAILDAVKAGEWAAVRQELDRTEATARATMIKMGDGELATCVSLGGWLRGTEVASAVIAKSYTGNKAELLNQPELARHFAKSVRAIGGGPGASPKLEETGVALDKILVLMGDGGGKPVGSGAVGEINATCRSLVDLILGLAPKAVAVEVGG